MKFDVICADPPFAFSDALKMSQVARGAEANYPVMSIDDIKNMPVKQLANPTGCILCLWVPSSLLQEGLDIMKIYGFHHKQTYIWVKSKKDVSIDLTKDLLVNLGSSISQLLLTKNPTKEVLKLIKNNVRISNDKLNNITSFGMGRLFRNCHEICLIGINNSGIYKKLKNKSQRTVCLDQNIRHSQKPEHLQNSLDLMFPNCNKLEIFSRRQRTNWICIGNEVGLKQDITKSIEELILL